MINSNIKVDLHIHSIYSEYKETTEIVKKSTFENIEVLLDKLLDKGINLFSITDHNRFSSELYLNIKEKLDTDEKYKNKINIIAGIEFDVKFENEKKDCHVITIFNVLNDSDAAKIEQVINNNLLSKKNDFYSLKEYEEILEEIGLSTIVIVCQRKALDNTKGDDASLSDSAKNPIEILKYGYINALEYKSVTNEGILKRNLVDSDLPQATVCGSDCHEWSAYPFHDYNQKTSYDKDEDYDLQYYFQIKALPTFMGLLLALTSPGTRFNRINNENDDFLSKIIINDKEIEISPGINAIIGDNGSGKTSLLNIILNNVKEAHVKKIKDENRILTFPQINLDNCKYIYQSELIEKYNNNEFVNEYKCFQNIDNTEYENKFNKFVEYLTSKINYNISVYDKRREIERSKDFCFNEQYEKETYFYQIEYEDDFSNTNNNFNDRLNNLYKIINLIRNEVLFEVYTDYEKEILNQTLNNIKSLTLEIFNKYEKIEYINKVTNYIKNNIDKYNENINVLQTTQDKQKSNYVTEKKQIKTDIIDMVKLYNIEIKEQKFPCGIKGISNNENRGFRFQKVAHYNEKNLLDDYLKSLFNNGYQDVTKLFQLNNKEELRSAITRCAKGKDPLEEIKLKSKEFYNKSIETNQYIIDTSNNQQIGATLGEESLMYYRFFAHNNSPVDVFIIDQPEDNISNIKIKEQLISYFNKLRGNKQVIIVTHNPLLVVNLDVDNVICLERKINKINVKAGCLEDESEQIMKFVSDNLDGGKEIIERRLKFYGEIN